jgi:hypothetical protein
LGLFGSIYNYLKKGVKKVNDNVIKPTGRFIKKNKIISNTLGVAGTVFDVIGQPEIGLSLQGASYLTG